MIKSRTFDYEPGEHEAEKASNSYLMSLIAVIAGVPLPIINLLATLIFFLGNRRGTYFVRWHCMQALFSQLSLFLINSFGFWWTISIVFTEKEITNSFIAYIICGLIFNVAELTGTIYTAIQTRKGQHIHWWFFGGLTDLVCKKND